MPAVNLPTGCKGLEASPKNREEVKNLFYTSGDNPVLSIRPGEQAVGLGSGACRGSVIFRNSETGTEELYQVSGQKLVRVTIINHLARKELSNADISIDEIGAIPGSSKCVILGGFTKMLVMEIGGKAWVYDNTDGLKEIDDESFLPSVSVTYDNGRFVFVPADGSRFFWSELGDPSDILPQSAADAELFPDPNKAVFTRKGTLFVLGSRSVEQLDYNANFESYVRLAGISSSVGYVGGMTEYLDTFAFVGQGSNGDFNIYAMGQSAEPISNEYVSELINNEYSLPDIINMRAQHFVWKGTPMLIFYFPRHTLVFYGGWAFWQNGITGESIGTWNINNIQYAYGFLWTGDNKSNVIGVLRDSGSDYSDPGKDIEWLLRTYIKAPAESNFIISKLFATCTMGRADKEPQISVRVSRDGVIYGPDRYASLGRVGEYNRQLRWTGTIAKGYDFVGIIYKGYGSAVMNMDGIGFE